MRILVTGGHGQLGRDVTTRARARGHEVVALDPVVGEAAAPQTEVETRAPAEGESVLQGEAELWEVVIPTPPVEETSPPREPEEIDPPVTGADGWVEIASEEGVDPSDWAGSG